MSLFRYIGLWLFATLLLGACWQIKDDAIRVAEVDIPEQIDFNFHVKPILSDRCFTCHGLDANQRKGDLRLDIDEKVYGQASNESSIAQRILSPGSLKKSEVAHRIVSSDPNYMMPPPETNLPLTPEEKATILRWIEQGAEYKEHWSFIPVVKPPSPALKNEQWINNDIDRFILAQIESKDMVPNPQADINTLHRRIALDLTGLPPSLEELSRFSHNDTSVEDIIDHYLDKPQYGEKMALEWLDVARYADSHGYQDDGMRNTWPWRDWVINSFNSNMPFDTFLLWQLAGDMLENPTTEQLLATCFNRNHPQSQEGGVVDEEYRVEYVADRTNTLGKGLLGLTLECARCHEHKYDPITQKDYYALFAYFNNNNDAGIVPYNGEAAPTIILPTDRDQRKIDSLSLLIKSLEKKIEETDFKTHYRDYIEKINVRELLPDKTGLMADFDFEFEREINRNAIYLDKGPRPKNSSKKDVGKFFAYLNRAKGKLDAANWGHNDDRPVITSDGHRGNGIHFLGDAGIRLNRDLDFDRDQPFSVSVWIKMLKEGEEGPIFGNTNGDFEGYRGWLCKLNSDGTLSFQLNHVWPDNCIDYQTTEKLPVDQWVHLGMTYDGSSKAKGVKFFINGVRPEYLLHADNLKKSLLHGVKGTNWSNQPFLLGMELRKSMKNMFADDLQVYNRTLSKIEIKNLFGEKNLTADEDELFEYYLLSGKNKLYNELQEKLQQLRKEINLLLTDQPEVMVMKERKHRRQTYILNRGAYDAPTDPVEADIPEIFRADKSVGGDRLSLARWVVSKENPLTARVQVNRIWYMCFGKGLVATQEDFGSQGNLPTHPELLDFLAYRFMDTGWDIKALLREIMLSATYRQDARVSDPAKSVDPENLYYSHYPSHRLSAEVIRDQALAASGLLVTRIGGPSVYPYQPEGIWEALATRNATKYVQQSGDSLYRRSMYTVWKRSSPPPSMLNFDAPDRYYCVVRRQNTSTPLQSLVLMNDPQFVEAAKALAEKMVSEELPEDAITLAFLRLVGRNPREQELEILNDLLVSTVDKIENQELDPGELLSIGEYDADGSLDRKKLAAHTVVASTIMNYDDFITKR